MSFTHQLGYLTAVPGWADSINYHANGMLNEIAHTNGVVYAQGLDPHWRRRPASLGVTNPLTSLALAEGEAGPLAVPLPTPTTAPATSRADTIGATATTRSRATPRPGRRAPPR